MLSCVVSFIYENYEDGIKSTQQADKNLVIQVWFLMASLIFYERIYSIHCVEIHVYCFYANELFIIIHS